MDAKVRHEDSKEGRHDERSSIAACNLCCRHIKNFSYISAILTDFIKKSTTWHWGPQEQQASDELKDKAANAKCLCAPEAQGKIILVIDASNVMVSSSSRKSERANARLRTAVCEYTYERSRC